MRCRCVLQRRIIFVRVRKDNTAAGNCNIKGRCKGEDVDDDQYVRSGGPFLQSAKAPFAADLVFSLVEYHRADSSFLIILPPFITNLTR